jgi:hypothetical protein
MHLKPTAGCQISNMIIETNCGGGTLLIMGKNVAVLDIFLWDIYRDPLHNLILNIKVGM